MTVARMLIRRQRERRRACGIVVVIRWSSCYLGESTRLFRSSTLRIGIIIGGMNTSINVTPTPMMEIVWVPI